jgi:hypothetical protein
MAILLPTACSSAKLSPEVLMMTTPASAIREEVWELIDDQIEACGRPSRLTPSELSECHYRAERIKQLSRTRPDQQYNHSGDAVREGGISLAAKRSAIESSGHAGSRWQESLPRNRAVA